MGVKLEFSWENDETEVAEVAEYQRYANLFITPGTAEHFLQKLEKLTNREVAQRAIGVFKFKESTVGELMTFCEKEGGNKLKGRRVV
jgi:hypothetical protein